MERDIKVNRKPDLHFPAPKTLSPMDKWLNRQIKESGKYISTKPFFDLFDKRETIIQKYYNGDTTLFKMP